MKFIYQKISAHNVSSAVALLLLILGLGSCKQPSQEEVYNKIQRSPVLKSLDELCESIPKPDGMEISYKKISGNSYTATVNQGLRGKISFTMAAQLITTYLKENGWNEVYFRNEPNQAVNGQFMYKKGDNFMYLEHTRFPDAYYEIGCSREF